MYVRRPKGRFSCILKYGTLIRVKHSRYPMVRRIVSTK